jgi:hypothetical protein
VLRNNLLFAEITRVGGVNEEFALSSFYLLKRNAAVVVHVMEVLT